MLVMVDVKVLEHFLCVIQKEKKNLVFSLLLVSIESESVSQLPVVRSEHVRTVSDSSDTKDLNLRSVRAYEFYAAIHIKAHLENAQYHLI